MCIRDSHSYTDENLSVTITELREYDTTIYAVDVVLSDVSQLRTAFANNTYGRNIKQTTSAMAADHAAILAINGDYYGFRNSGYVLRNGVLYRSSVSGSEDLSVMADGTFRILSLIHILFALGADQANLIVPDLFVDLQFLTCDG